MLKKVFWGVIALYVVFLVLINSQSVPFNYIAGSSAQVKLDFIIVISFAAGILAVMISNFIGKSQIFFKDMLSYSANKKEKRLAASLCEAVEFIELGDDKKAKQILISYLKEKMDNVDAYLLITDIYLDEGSYVDAEEMLRDALVASKHDVTILNKLGDVYVESKKYNKAIKTFEELRQKEGGKDIYLKKIYDIYLLKNDFKNAFKSLKELIKNGSVKGLEPELLLVKYNYALTLIKEGDFDGAEKSFKRIIDKDKRFYSAYVSYAQMLVDKGDVDRAEKLLIDSYEETKFPYFAKMLERIALKNEEPDKALKFYRRQIDSIELGHSHAKGSQAWKDSQALVLYALYVNLLLKLEMIDYAIEAIDDVVGTEDDKMLFHLFLAKSFKRHRNFEAAVDQYSEFMRSRSLHPMKMKCYICGAEFDEFTPACSSCGTYNKINYFVN